jgi:hypothetical protein
MTNRRAKADREDSLADPAIKPSRDEVRAEAAATGTWRFPFQMSRQEMIARIAARRPNLSEAEINTLLDNAEEKAFLELWQIRNSKGISENVMERIIEELQDFNTFDGLIEQLKIASCEQRYRRNSLIVTIAALLLEKISKEGYRPPRASARQRRDTRAFVQFEWALKREYMTVEEFKAHMNDDFGIPEGTVLKILYATENRFLKLLAQIDALD